jgi:hypothetical protein
MIVTNLVGKLKNGVTQTGFYMDGYEVSNYLGIKTYLDKDWDCVGIISGHGKVRIGKSRKAFQIASFIAWILAGGVLKIEQVPNGNKVKWVKHVEKHPTQPVRFNLEENVIFSAADLQKRAFALYEKYGKNQIIVYDEGREGLDAKRAMESLNKVMEDFFQECGFMGHVILIVLPNFFKLHEDYAVSRSIFLVDCFADKKKRRGYFNFYDEKQKEWLYFLGKKKIGITQKYTAAYETFWGRFTSWFPFDEVKYNAAKQEALKKRRRTARQMSWKKQRDATIYMYVRDTGKDHTNFAKELTQMTGELMQHDTVSQIIRQFNDKGVVA